MNFKISYEQKPSPNDVNRLWEGLSAYAKQQKNQDPGESFAFFIRDDNQQIKGGCSGYLYYGCLYIDLLWLDESIRHLGYGSQLMKRAEQLGKEKNCNFVTVNTMDWEALDFYKKLGYWVEFERQGYLKDSTFYFLRKNYVKD